MYMYMYIVHIVTFPISNASITNVSISNVPISNVLQMYKFYKFSPICPVNVQSNECPMNVQCPMSNANILMSNAGKTIEIQLPLEITQSMHWKILLSPPETTQNNTKLPMVPVQRTGYCG